MVLEIFSPIQRQVKEIFCIVLIILIKGQRRRKFQKIKYVFIVLSQYFMHDDFQTKDFDLRIMGAGESGGGGEG